MFGIAQTRAAGPLLPLGILTDRGRAAALIALLLASAGLFTTFLFLPFYLQTTLDYSQTETGLSVLPAPIALFLSAAVVGPALTRALGARLTTPLGLALAGGGALLLTRLGLDSGYLSHLLPSLVLIGAGIGLVIATATGAATVRLPDDLAGAAAATVNAAQQVGVAVLSTVAASAAAAFAAADPLVSAAAAAVHSYTTPFAWTGAVFLAGALLTALVAPAKERTS